MSAIKWLPLIIILACACGDVTNSPFSDEVNTDVRGYNLKALSRIDGTGQGAFSFALLTDSHQNYTDLSKVVRRINSMADVVFSIHLGDFTDYGYNYEYDLFMDNMKLSAPSFIAVGNHDIQGRRFDIFKKVIGPWNLSFVYSGIKFIVFNNISIEIEPDYAWIFNEINSHSGPVLVFAHADPLDKDFAYSQYLIEQDTLLLTNPKVKAVFHGHDHLFSVERYYYNGGANFTLLQQVQRIEEENFVKVTIDRDQTLSIYGMSIFQCVYGQCNEEMHIDF